MQGAALAAIVAAGVAVAWFAWGQEREALRSTELGSVSARHEPPPEPVSAVSAATPAEPVRSPAPASTSEPEPDKIVEAPRAETVTITGIAVDETGAPVGGAEISTDLTRAHTRANGSFHMEAPRQRAQKYAALRVTCLG